MHANKCKRERLNYYTPKRITQENWNPSAGHAKVFSLRNNAPSSWTNSNYIWEKKCYNFVRSDLFSGISTHRANREGVILLKLHKRIQLSENVIWMLANREWFTFRTSGWRIQNALLPRAPCNVTFEMALLTPELLVKFLMTNHYI